MATRKYFGTLKVIIIDWYYRHITFWVICSYSEWVKYEYVPDEITCDVDFTDEAVVEWDNPVVNDMAIYKWSQINFDVNN